MTKQRPTKGIKRYSQYVMKLEEMVDRRNAQFIRSVSRLYRFSEKEIAQLLSNQLSSAQSERLLKSMLKNPLTREHPYFRGKLNSFISKTSLSETDRVMIQVMERTSKAGSAALSRFSSQLEGISKSYISTLSRPLNHGRVVTQRKIERMQVITDRYKSIGNISPFSRWAQSDREYTERIASALMKGVSEGVSPQRLSREFSQQFDEQFSRTNRILRTESAAVESETSARVYKDAGVKKYQIFAHDDEKTCDTCGSEDGEVYLVSQKSEGENCPPFHPWCRCTIAPFFEDGIDESEIDDEYLEENVNKYLSV